MNKCEEFEKWSRRYIPDLKMSIDEGEYIDDEQRNNFEVWQSATKQSEARIKELEEANKLFVQWVGVLGFEVRRMGIHVTIEGLDYAATLRKLTKNEPTNTPS